jgi:spermidine synthase
MPKLSSHYYLLTIAAATGAVSTFGQAMTLREANALFCGFEPAVGAVLAGWLLWVAVGGALGARYARTGKADRRLVGAAAVAIGAALPATLLFLRASRRLWSIPGGELPTLQTMLGVAWTSAAPFCLLSGALFSLCWAATQGCVGRERQSSGVYVAEALGATLGGLAAFLIVPWGGRLLDAAFCVGGAAAVLGAWGLRGATWPLRAVVGLCLLGLLAGSLMAGRLELLSRGWLWPPASGELLAVRETALQSLALTRSGSPDAQYSLFSSGVWSFSLPDPLSAEHVAHPALLQHPAPQTVLCVGGDFYGLAKEIFKHPSVRRLDYVDPDPDARAFLEAHVPEALRRLPQDVSLVAGQGEMGATALSAPSEKTPRAARVFHRDAAAFVRDAAKTLSTSTDARGYDVLLLLVGEPLNAQRNRFHTVEFFQRVRQTLAPGGILVLSLPAGLEAVGPAQAQQLRRAYATLAAVFPALAVLPGDEARFFASATPGGVSSQAGVLIERMRGRDLTPSYARPDVLTDLLNPFKTEYFTALLKSSPSPELNRDFSPACFADSLALWSLQAGWSAGPRVWRLAQGHPWLLWIATVLGALLLARCGTRELKPALRRGIALAGGAGMTLEIGLLLGYQILQGELHSRLALFVAAYMAGLGFGAATPGKRGAPSRRLLRAHGGLCLALAAAPALLWGARYWPGAAWVLDAAFATHCLAGGWLGGRYYALAVALHPGRDSAEQAGMLYAADTFGAALAALLVPLVLIPLYGVETGFAVCGLLCLGGYLGLRRALSAP